MSSRQIKAGGAFVEIMARDKTGAGLASAQTRLAVFARGVKAMSTALAGGLRAIGHGMTFVGTAVAAAGAGILAALGASVKTFLAVSAQAKAMGKSIAGIDPAKAERLSDAIETLKAVWGAIQFNIGNAIAEPLTNLLKVLIRLGMAAANFIRANPQLVVAIAAIAAVALIGGLAIAALGSAFLLAASAVAGVSAILTAIATPVGIAIALVAALAAAVLLMGAAWLIAGEMSSGAISGIVAALASGDILKAWAIVTKGMEMSWKSLMYFLTSAMNATLESVSGAFGSFVKELAKELAAIERTTGIPTGHAALSAFGAGVGAAGKVTADVGNSTAAGDFARAMGELAAMSADARNKALGAFAGVGFSIPDLAKLTNSGNRQGFGTTGSTNATTAGQNRTLGGIEKEQKKTNEHLDRILQVLKGVKAEGALEFAP